MKPGATEESGRLSRWLQANEWPVLGLIAVLEIFWLAWVLNDPLPNAKTEGATAWRRSYMLMRFLPEVVPGVHWRESFLYFAQDELSHVENLPQRLPIVLAASLVMLAAISLGRLILRGLGLIERWGPSERLVSAFGLGMTGLGIVALVFGRAGWLSPWTTRAGLAIIIAIEFVATIRVCRDVEVREVDREGVSAWSIASLLLVVGPFVIVMALASMLPTIDFDAIEYHLQGPKEYYLNRKIEFLPHNVYTSMPFSIEMLHLIGMHLVDDWWRGALVGQLLVMSFAPMAGLTIWVTLRRWGSPRSAWVGVAVYLTTPWVYRLAAIPYVEGPLCFYHALLIWAAGVAWSAEESARDRIWLMVGALAGGAMAIKYTTLISAVIPFGLVALGAAWHARSPRIVVAFGLGFLLTIGPWLAKNVADTGNPVYPLGYRVFGGRDWNPEREAQWSAAHGPKPIEAKALMNSIIEVAGRSDWQSPAFFALAPLAFLRPTGRRFTRWVAVYVISLFATWWLFTHRLDRFWLPMLPGLAILAGLGADWSRRWAWNVVLVFVLAVTIVSNMVYCSTALAALNEWTGNLDDLRTSVPKRLNASLHRIDTELPPDARPLLVGQAAVFHLVHPVVYNTVFDREIFETIDRDRTPAEVRRELARRGITHIYVDWFEIERYRSPGNYGFTSYVTPERFDRLVEAGVLSEPRKIGAKQVLYTVLPAK